MSAMNTARSILQYEQGGSWVTVAGVNSMPDFTTTPSQLQATDLSMEAHVYIPGLMDTEELEFGAVYTTAGFGAMNTLANTNANTNFRVVYPDSTGYTFAGQPFVGVNGLGVDEVMEYTITVIVSVAPNYVTGLTNV